MSQKTNELLDERDEKLALQVLAESDGGKVIVKTLKQDIGRLVSQITTDYRSVDHIALVSLCADLRANLSLYQALTRAKQHVKTIEEIIEETPME